MIHTLRRLQDRWVGPAHHARTCIVDTINNTNLEIAAVRCGRYSGNRKDTPPNGAVLSSFFFLSSFFLLLSFRRATCPRLRLTEPLHPTDRDPPQSTSKCRMLL